MEQWKKIDGWERYEVSTKGNIRNTQTGRILKVRPDKEGYKIVTFSVDCVRTTQKVHRLVAKAFLINEPGKTQVNHKDGNKTNNEVENLEWCTSAENHTHAYKELGRQANISQFKKRVRCVETGKIYESAAEAAREISALKQPLSSVCRGERKTYKGFHWEYIA